MQHAPRHLQQRAPQGAATQRTTFAHAAQPLRAGTAQQLEQHGLGLVVAVLGGQQAFVRLQRGGQGGVACVARGGFQAVTAAALNLHRQHVAGDAKFRAEPPAVRGPRRAVGMQAVVDVQCAQSARARRRQLCQRVQQRG